MLEALAAITGENFGYDKQAWLAWLRKSDRSRAAKVVSMTAAKTTEAARPIDPRRAAREIQHQVRALSPHIGATLGIDGQQFKIWRVKPTNAGAVPGLVRDAGRIVLGTASGGLEIVELQPPGKGRMHADAFLRGYRGDLTLTS